MVNESRAIIILGLKFQFKDLWEKVQTIDIPVCNCPISNDEYIHCPYCGVKKGTNQVKIYKSLITGEESTIRSIDEIVRYLYPLGVGVWDVDPNGYTDSTVYLYLTNPYCCINIDSSDPFKMTSIINIASDSREKMLEKIGQELFDMGDWGLWGFLKQNKKRVYLPPSPPPSPQLSPDHDILPPAPPGNPTNKRPKIDPVLLSFLTTTF